MLGVLIEHPLLALIPTALFLAVAIFSRSRISFSAAALWTLYVLWELGMKARILCSGECNIRVDLLLIYPVLAVLSLLSLVSAARRLLTK